MLAYDKKHIDNNDINSHGNNTQYELNNHFHIHWKNTKLSFSCVLISSSAGYIHVLNVNIHVIIELRVIQ